MVTLQPAHTVYAAQEDTYQRDRQADDYAEEEMQERVWALAQLAEEGTPTQGIADCITDAIRAAYVAGWNTARDQQRNG